MKANPNCFLDCPVYVTRTCHNPHKLLIQHPLFWKFALRNKASSLGTLRNLSSRSSNVLSFIDKVRTSTNHTLSKEEEKDMAARVAKTARTAKKSTRGAKKATQKAKKVAGRSSVSRLVTKVIDPGWAWDDRLPLAQAKQIGNTIYVSGQVAYSPEGKLVGEGDMKAQTRQVYENIKTILAAAGAGVEDIIKINTYITDQSKFMDMLAVRSEIFGNNPPASTAVVVAGLAFPGLLIEVEAIAIKAG